MPGKRIGMKQSLGMVWRVSSYMGPKRKWFVIGGLLAALEMLSAYSILFVMAQVTDLVASGGKQGDIGMTLLMIFFLLCLTPLICLGTYLQRTSAAIGNANLRERMFQHIQRLPVSQAMEYRTGDYITLMTSDVNQAGGMLQGFSFTSLFRFMVLFTLSFASLLFIGWEITLLGVCMSVTAAAASTILNPRVRALASRAQKFTADSASSLLELTTGAVVVRVYLLGEKLLEKYRKVCREICRMRIHFRFLSGLVDSFLLLFQAAAKPIAFLFGVLLLTKGDMDISTVVLASGMVGVMADATQNLSNFIAFIQSGLASAQRVFQLLDQPEEKERETVLPMDFTGDIAVEMDGVGFAYPSAGRERVLDQLSFQVRRGEKVAIVGGSGGGKTTIFKLLQDFYTPQEGEIRLFRRPIPELSRTDARQAAAYVPQDCAVFDGTIGENIGWGRPGSNQEEIREAARLAGIGEFIESLPNGYQTMVGERGTQLSGGQRQRIAIARAFLKDAPLLMLDEATSALDSETEAVVLQALDRLMEGRTTLVVAHRLSTIRSADRILVMEHGKFVEEGSHEALMAKNGRYRELYEMQFSKST